MNPFLDFRKILHEEKRRYSDLLQCPVIGWTCTYLPLEILEAAGISPYRILPETSSDKADAYLDPNFCPFLKASLGKALEGGYSFLSGIIMLNSCDGMRRLYDAWRFYCYPPFSYLLDIPRIVTPSAITFFRDELRDLINQIEDHFRIKISEDGLGNAIEEANTTRSYLKHLFTLQGRGDPPLMQSNILEIVSEGWKNPRKVFNKSLKLFIERLETYPPNNLEGPKVMVTGSLMEGSALIRLVEELGGQVVSSELCVGNRITGRIVLDSDPLGSLSKAYLEKTSCARMYDTERRIRYLIQELKRTQAQGLIYFSLKFCDPYLYEAPAIEETLRKMGMPMLFIEGEYTGKMSGGIRTRVQAFLEVLERDARE